MKVKLKHQHLFWRILFYSFVIIDILMLGLGVWAVLFISDIPVLIELPANVWMLLIFGSVGRSFTLGFFTYYSYRQYKDLEIDIQLQKAIESNKRLPSKLTQGYINALRWVINKRRKGDLD